MPTVAEFFAYARERHGIALRRAAGAPRPWTDDPILRQYRFTNVFRERDKTTVWFREKVRSVLPTDQLLPATVLFRWLNRIATGEAIFLQKHLGGGTAWEQFLRTGDLRTIEDAIVAYCGKGPYVTGAYMIRSPNGMDKLPGMLHYFHKFWSSEGHVIPDSGLTSHVSWREMCEILEANRTWSAEPDCQIGLQQVHGWLRQFEGQGPFHSYEVVTDLRHTALLDTAPDIDTWANPGPGAKRGLNRIHGRSDPDPRKPKHKWRPTGISDEQYLGEMQQILVLSRQRRHWPQDGTQWPRWELRDVEHTLCEFDKHQRVLTGEGTPRGRFE